MRRKKVLVRANCQNCAEAICDSCDDNKVHFIEATELVQSQDDRDADFRKKCQMVGLLR